MSNEQPPSQDELFNTHEKNVDDAYSMSMALIIGIIVVGIVLSLLFYYFMYKQYSSGQNHCSVLYPGNSLKDLRLRDECKDRKRRNWAMPASAMLIN